MYSFRLVKQNINVQLHYNLNRPQTDCANNPEDGIRANEVVKYNELTRIVAWCLEPKMHLSLLRRIRPGKWCNIRSGQNNLSGWKVSSYPKIFNLFFFSNVSERLSLHLPLDQGTLCMGTMWLDQPKEGSAKRENITMPHAIRESESYVETMGQSMCMCWCPQWVSGHRLRHRHHRHGDS